MRQVRDSRRTRPPARRTASGLACALTAFMLLTATAPAGAAVTARSVPAVTAPGVLGWGENAFGEVGNGTRAAQASPVPVAVPGSVVQIAANGYNGAALLASGALATWGSDSDGQIGDGRYPAPRTTPFLVPGLSGIVQAAVGANHMLALDSSGRVWSWGNNNYGELGNGTATGTANSNPVPAPVPGLTGVTQISAGTGYSLALRSDGTVWAWGRNNFGQLGDGTTLPRLSPGQVPGLTGISRVYAGSQTSYAIGPGGTVRAFGDNLNGLLGTGTSAGISATPVPVPGLTGVTALSTADEETLAVTGPGGALWAWGSNIEGEAGDGTTTPHYSPEPVSLTGVTAVASGGGWSAAVLASGRLMTWGSDALAALGHPSTTTPALVPALTAVTQVAAADFSGLAVGSAAPRVPSVIGEVQATATAELQAAGLTTGRVTTVVDLTCQYIGVVKTQSPAAGSFAQPGTAVSLAIGKAGGKCLGD
jgi:alpha-tubulin suppressor-like RCC1 family protein